MLLKQNHVCNTFRIHSYIEQIESVLFSFLNAPRKIK